MVTIDTTSTIQPDDPLAGELHSITETIIKPIVRRALRTSLNADDTRSRNQDALELVGDIQVMIMAAIAARHENDENGNGAIRDLRGYAARTAQNACYFYFRTNFPERTSQENKLRYALKHMAGVSLWKREDGRWLCGTAVSESTQRSEPVPIDASIAESWTALETRDGYLKALHSVFARHESPILFDDLLDLMVEVLGIREARITGSESERIEDLAIHGSDKTEQKYDDTDDQTPRLKRLWMKLSEMPLRHRKALLLNLKYKGRDLVRLLPLSGVASLHEIAAALEFTEDEFASVLSSLPWDDLRIAEHLGVTRQQVINLRQYVRSRLYSVAGD